MILVLQQSGCSLGKKSEILVVKKEMQQREVSIRHVESVIVMRASQISYDATMMLSRRGIPILYLDKGNPVGAVMPFAYHGFVATRRAQFAAYTNEKGFELVRSMLVAAATNKVRLLKYYARNRRRTDSKVADQIMKKVSLMESLIEELKKVHKMWDFSTVDSKPKSKKTVHVAINKRLSEINESDTETSIEDANQLLIKKSQEEDQILDKNLSEEDKLLNKNPPEKPGLLPIEDKKTSSLGSKEADPIGGSDSEYSEIPSLELPLNNESESNGSIGEIRSNEESPPNVGNNDKRDSENGDNIENNDELISSEIEFMDKDFDSSIESFLQEAESPTEIMDEEDFITMPVSKTPLAIARQTLMGIEGTISNMYFDAMCLVFNSRMPFEGRNRRPPKDPINAALSLGYALLAKEVLMALSVVGLEPYAGFLHTDRSGRPSLVFDLIEEFRQPVVDRLVVRLFQQRIFGVKDFNYDNQEGGVKFTEPALSRFFGEFYYFLRKDGQHIGKSFLVFQQIIINQARQMVRFLLNKNDIYEGFTMEW